MTRLEILNEVYGKTEWSVSALSALLKVIELSQRESRKQQLKSILDALDLMHDAANGQHNYYKVAVNLLKAEYGE